MSVVLLTMNFVMTSCRSTLLLVVSCVGLQLYFDNVMTGIHDQ